MATPLRRLMQALPPLALAWLGVVAAVRAEPPAAGGWNARTAPPPAPEEPAGTETQLKVRVYEDFAGHRSRPGADDTPLALDADVRMVTCPDGNREVSGMDIGGAPYEADATCIERAAPGALRVEDGVRREVEASAGPAATPAPATPPRCDPQTWRCVEQPAATPPSPPPR